MAAPAQSQGELISGINVTPMVDVVLVLLVVLMVTASYTVSKSLPMDLPKAATGEKSENTPLAISVDESGALFLDGRAMSREELREKVKNATATSSVSALIAADGGAAHRSVVSVIDLLRGEGVTKFAINVAREDLVP